jgi:hypothetical protein
MDQNDWHATSTPLVGGLAFLEDDSRQTECAEIYDLLFSKGADLPISDFRQARQLVSLRYGGKFAKLLGISLPAAEGISVSYTSYDWCNIRYWPSQFLAAIPWALRSYSETSSKPKGWLMWTPHFALRGMCLAKRLSISQSTGPMGWNNCSGPAVCHQRSQLNWKHHLVLQQVTVRISARKGIIRCIARTAHVTSLPR